VFLDREATVINGVPFPANALALGKRLLLHLSALCHGGLVLRP